MLIQATILHEFIDQEPGNTKKNKQTNKECGVIDFIWLD